MKNPPKEITCCWLSCVVMPQGEIICDGQTIGWVKNIGKFLKKADKNTGKEPK